MIVVARGYVTSALHTLPQRLRALVRSPPWQVVLGVELAHVRLARKQAGLHHAAGEGADRFRVEAAVGRVAGLHAIVAFGGHARRDAERAHPDRDRLLAVGA